jgi:hypothetical protein
MWVWHAVRKMTAPAARMRPPDSPSTFVRQTSAVNLEIRLHLGAHKTATTHVQQTLFQNCAKLAEAGVHYIELNRLREIFTRPFFRVFRGSAGPPHPSSVQMLRTAIRNELERAEAERNRQFHTLVISDENIMGDIPLLARTGRLYGDRSKRLRLVKAIFRGCPITVALTIRNYNDLYPSLYGQLIKQGQSVSYGDFLQKLDFENNSWHAIVADLSHIFGRDRIRLFRYEDYPGNMEVLIESIVGRRLSLELDPGEIVYPSLNTKGIELLLAAGDVLSREEKSRLGDYLASEFVFDRDYGKPSIEEPALRNLLDRKYQRDETELAVYLQQDKTAG